MLDTINEASKNVNSLLNQKLQVAPVFIKKISTSDNSNDNIDTSESSKDSCYIIIKGRYQTNGYARGEWISVEYNGFYSTLQEAENEIGCYL